jgi:hypothetical protein
MRLQHLSGYRNITEARANGWLGEVQGLQVSLNEATRKLVALDRAGQRRGSVSLVDRGIPVIVESKSGDV